MHKCFNIKKGLVDAKGDENYLVPVVKYRTDRPLLKKD
jgi:hypothetical protein